MVALAALAVAYARYLMSDAYRDGNRLFYRAGRPTGAGKAFGRFWTTLADRGLTPAYVVTLETTGHRSGRHFSIPVVLADVAGGTYVVSMLGERPPWVRNVRAADGLAVIRHRGPRTVRLVEVPVDERAPILRDYLRRASGARPHFPINADADLADFARIAQDYPVFRIESAD
jgi:deazaflavin-dependent oxidoreductase (nitroreductase family)